MMSLHYIILINSCASFAAQADEYYSIGMAYYEMGKYEDAEKWLTRASSLDKTMTASEYNLGRIAFERGRYEEAAKRFEGILKKDPDNVMALKAAAYSRIKNGDLPEAEAHYARVLELVPESADDGYNYALVLYSTKRYADCEATLKKYPYTMEDNKNAVLLLARAEAAQGKIEAADIYAEYVLANPGNPQVLYEYGGVLEKIEAYAKALEQYRAALSSLAEDTEKLTKGRLHFDIARVLITADPENAEIETELKAATEAGFKDIDAVEKVIADPDLKEANLKLLEAAVGRIRNPSIETAGESETELSAETEGGNESEVSDTNEK